MLFELLYGMVGWMPWRLQALPHVLASGEIAHNGLGCSQRSGKVSKVSRQGKLGRLL